MTGCSGSRYALRGPQPCRLLPPSPAPPPGESRHRPPPLLAQSNDPALTSLTVLRFRAWDTAAVTALSGALAGNSTLTELYASGRPLEPAGLAALSSALGQNASLRLLNVGDAAFGDAGLRGLAPGVAASRSLVRLDLDGKGVGADGLGALAAAVAAAGGCALRELVVSRNRLSAAAVAALGPLLPRLSRLEASGCGIDAAGAAALAGGLAAARALRHVDLSGGNAVGDGAALGRALAACPELRHLDVSGAPLAGAGALLGPLAAAGAALDALDLSGCGLGDAGAAEVAAALSGGLRARRLAVRGNRLGPAGARALAGACGGAVSDLDLAGNPGVPGDATPVLAAVPGLQRLSLFGCGLGDAGVDALCDALRGGGLAAARELDLGGNGAGRDALGRLLALLAEPGVAPALRVVEVAANPGTSEEAVEADVERFFAARSGVDVVWRMAAGQGDSPPQ